MTHNKTNGCSGVSERAEGLMLMAEQATITTRRAAEILAVDARTVLLLVRRGELAASYTWRGRQRIWWFLEADVQRVADERKRATAYQPEQCGGI